VFASLRGNWMNIKNNLQQGITLIELLVTVAILGIVTVVGIPAFSNMIERQRFDADVEAVIVTAKYARLEASRRQSFVFMTRTTNTKGDVFTVATADTVAGDKTTLRVVETGLAKEGSADDEMYFRPNGMMNEDASRNTSFCRKSGEKGYDVEILTSGRIRVTSKTCS
jgi:type IV fimbrial biogenesis protein FimT